MSAVRVRGDQPPIVRTRPIRFLQTVLHSPPCRRFLTALRYFGGPSGVLMLCCAWSPVAAIAASPLANMVPKRVAADPDKDYFISETNGPWTILAATFSGDGAEKQAKALMLELREKHKMAAYQYRKNFDFTKGERGRGIDRFGEPLKMRHQRDIALTEIAVLVGDFPSVDDDDAQKTLKKIKYMQPDALDLEKQKSTSQTLAALRTVQKNILPETSEFRKKGPMGSAFIITNPLLPPDYFAPKGLDKFVLDMNKGVKFSLLDCKGRYTVKVATFTGQIVLDQQKIQKIQNGGKFHSRLQDAALHAHQLTEALREKGVEAYEFHDRYSSIVTVGSFNDVGTPRTDGKIEINPAIHAIIKKYGTDARLLPDHPTPQQSQPKSLAGISFDLSPIPVEVPRRSIAADYNRATASR